VGVTVTKKQIKGKVEVLDGKDNIINTEEHVLGEVVVDKPLANVGVKLGKTQNLGDYESLRVDVTLYMPSEVDKKSLDKTFKRCLKWCDKKMVEILS
jgi:hypothetical protein